MKPIAFSKTVWLNVIMTVIGALSLIPDAGILPSEYLPWVLFLQGIGNLVLRIWFTSEPLEKSLI